MYIFDYSFSIKLYEHSGIVTIVTYKILFFIAYKTARKNRILALIRYLIPRLELCHYNYYYIGYLH